MLTVDEDVLGLEIAVNEVVAVHVVDAAAHLKDDLACASLAHAVCGLLDLFEQIAFDELEDEEDAATLSKHFDQVDQVLVTQGLSKAHKFHINDDQPKRLEPK